MILCCNIAAVLALVLFLRVYGEDFFPPDNDK